MYIRIVASMLVMVGATIAVELAMLARLAGRQQSAVRLTPARSVESIAVPSTAPPDDSDAVLDRMIHRVEIPKMPLIQALDELSAQAGVLITLHGGAMWVSTGDDVEAHLGDVTLRDALNVLVRQVKPITPFSADGQTVVVGAEKMETRLYDLRPLMPQNPTGTSPDELCKLNAIYGALVDVIKSSVISEELWHRNGDTGSVTQWDGVLVVHETPHYHGAISRLLNQLALPHFTVPAPQTRPTANPTAWLDLTQDKSPAPEDILERSVAKLDIPPSSPDEALRSFSHQVGVDVVKDDGIIESQDPKSIEVHMHDVTVADAIGAILRQMSPMGHVSVRDGALRIGLGADLYPRIYDVRSMLTPVDQSASATGNGQALMQLIMQSVDPETWPDAGGTGRIQYWNGMLMIEQTAEVHHDVARMLAKLRDAEAPHQ